MVSATVVYSWEHAKMRQEVAKQIQILENILATWQLERGDDPLVVTMERTLRDLKAALKGESGQ